MVCYGVPDISNLKQWAALHIPFEYQDFMDPNLLDREDEIARRLGGPKQSLSSHFTI